jgi:hypothetical protein
MLGGRASRAGALRMNVYRKRKVPSIYLTIPWIRIHENNMLCDCIEDLDSIGLLKSVCSGRQCLSAYDDVDCYHVKATFPDEWKDYKAETNEVIYWSDYHWFVWDVLYLINGNRPTEAVDIKDTGLSLNFLESIEDPVSCIPLLLELKKIECYSELTTDLIESIKKRETELFSIAKLRKLKGSASYIPEFDLGKSTKPKNISVSLRKDILKRDNYRCLFYGRTSEDTALEVDHIIPRSLISKMNLDKSLNDAKYNLCTTCKDCNRWKRDNLVQEDIDYYLEKFIGKNDFEGIIEYLIGIKKLQEM